MLNFNAYMVRVKDIPDSGGASDKVYFEMQGGINTRDSGVRRVYAGVSGENRDRSVRFAGR